jgi:hypothetical protein
MIKPIIHICQDEKFIEAAKCLFNKTNNDNIYLVIVNNSNTSLNHVKKDSNTKILTRQEFKKIPDSISKNSVIIFHSIVGSFFDFINEVKEKHILIWMFFGMEIYNDPYLYSSKLLYSKLTRNLALRRNKNFKKDFKDSLRPYARTFKPNLPLSTNEKKKEIFNAFNFIGILYKEEYFNILKRTKIKKPDYLFFTYYPLEFIVDINQPINEFKNKIMIGNSGHMSSNHLDVFEKISNYNLESKEIIVPLSYGNGKYIEMIISRAKSYFNNDVEFLTDFLKLEDYNKILNAVEVFILYTRRQQGVGNIVALLWHGAKVFLSKRNTFYHYLKKMGVHVYCYETELNKKTINSGLTKTQIQENRKILFKYLNEEYLVKELNNQLGHILKD